MRRGDRVPITVLRHIRRGLSVNRNAAPAAWFLGFTLAGGLLAACSSPSTTTTTTTAGSAEPRGAGTIAVAGSTALLPLVKDAAGAYQDQHKDVQISVSGGGSATGINQVAAKAVDIGDSDILAAGHPELRDNRVAVVGFALVTNPSAGVKNLTKQQLRDIFSGKATNWNQVGGPDQKIVVVNRPRSSGTRAVFAKTVMGATPIGESGLTEDATGTAVSVVKQTPGAISYVALSGLAAGGDGSASVVSVDGVAPTPDAIESGKYPVWSYEHMYTNGAPQGEVGKFIDFVAHAGDLVKKNRFIAVGDMKVHESDR
jgi:phosphate transport system substrate-binding protein